MSEEPAAVIPPANQKCARYDRAEKRQAYRLVDAAAATDFHNTFLAHRGPGVDPDAGRPVGG